uniref:Transmembrane protein n=1 Tax=Schistosoma japonicum TaxID=6182 RepID=Q4JL31_SCHJA|nr:unknown [Schistosoma japonicum]
MSLVFRLPPKEYEFLVLIVVVYWILVIGHAAADYSLLIGIPLLPLIILQIALLLHVWKTLKRRAKYQSVKTN